MQVVGQSGGAVGAMAFARDGRMLWLAEGPRLVAVDMSDPASPLRMGRSSVEMGLVGAVAPGTRFVAALVPGGRFTELVLFAADPTRPEVLGRVRVSPSATQVAVIESQDGGATVIVADGAGLQVIDARNPAEPSHGGEEAILPIDSIVTIRSAGESLVVLADALWVFGLDAQGRLQPLAEHELGGGRALCSVDWGVVVVNQVEWRLYASFVDLRDPASPLVHHNWRLPVGRSPTVWQAVCFGSSLLVSGRAVSSLGPLLQFNLAYGLPNVDAPWEPPVEQSLPDLDLGPQELAHAALGASSILMVRQRGGVYILAWDASGYALQAPLFQPVGRAGRIAVRGGLAAVSSQDGTVRLLDLQDANAPRLISILEGPGACCWPPPALAWRDEVLWVAGNRLRAWDLRRSEAPVPLFDRPLEAWARDLAFVGERVVVAMGEEGIAIYSSNDPADPSPPQRWTFPGRRLTSGLAVRGDVLWLTEDSAAGGALRTLRVPSDGPIVGLGLLPSPAAADVALLGDHVALVGAPVGLTTRVVVVDGRDPRFPEALGEIDLPGSLDGRFPEGEGRPGRLLVALHGQGVEAIDVRVPAYPDETAHLRTPGDALDIAVKGDLAWLADGAGGLVAVHVGGDREARAWLPWVGGR